MDRYSYLYGTIESGPYSPMGSSAGLAPFLSRIGAASPSAVIDAVRNTLCGFKPLPGYEQQPVNDRPVALRYAPMHLYKRSDMPQNMQPFCALAVNGAENRPGGRDSIYSQTFFIAREDMHQGAAEQILGKTVRYSYLDQIFGTRLLSWTDMNAHRAGEVQVDCDELPQKVAPRMRQEDLALVLHTVRAVYEDRPVVIVTEKGCGFNGRAQEILLQIYSLLQPHLAADVGFATYTEPARMAETVRSTSIRIFVLPGECEIQPAHAEGMLVLDLNDPKGLPTVETDEMTKLILRWSRLDWSMREETMAAVFADTLTSYREKSLFMEKTAAFFTDPFFAWERSHEEDGSVADLESLRECYLRYPLAAQIPWVKERFIKKIPSLLAKPATLANLTAQTLAQALYADSEEAKKKAQTLYRFALDMGGADAIAAARASGETVRTQLTRETEAKLQEAARRVQQAQAETAAAVAQEKAKAEAAVQAEKEVTRQVRAEGETALAQAKADALAAIAVEQSKTAKAIEEGAAALEKSKAEAAQAVAAEQANTAKAVAEGAAAVSAVQKAAAEAKAAADARLLTEQQKTAAVQAELDNQKAGNARLNSELQASRAQIDAAAKDNAELSGRLEQAKIEYRKLREEKDAATAQIDAAKAEAAAAIRRGQDAEREAFAKVQEAQEAQAQAMEEAKAARRELRAIKTSGSFKPDRKTLLLWAGIGLAIGLVLMGIVLALVLILGGQQEEPAPVVEPTPIIVYVTPEVTATPVPTATPTPEPTPTATPVPTPSPTPDRTEDPIATPGADEAQEGTDGTDADGTSQEGTEGMTQEGTDTVTDETGDTAEGTDTQTDGADNSVDAGEDTAVNP